MIHAVYLKTNKDQAGIYSLPFFVPTMPVLSVAPSLAFARV
jgi:hypothetical protein